MVDIPGAFLQADMKGDDVHMKMEGKMAELFVKLDPKLYRKYITLEKGKSVLYVKFKKIHTWHPTRENVVLENAKY